jgi:hypothetical protein
VTARSPAATGLNLAASRANVFRSGSRLFLDVNGPGGGPRVPGAIGEKDYKKFRLSVLAAQGQVIKIRLERTSVVLWLEHQLFERCTMTAGLYLIIEIFTRIFSTWAAAVFGVQL